MRSRRNTGADERDAAFHSFVQQRGAPLQRSAYLLCGDWQLAEDIVQKTLAKVYWHWHRVCGADNPDAYVRRMLTNEVRQRWRRHEAPVGHGGVVNEPASADPTDRIVRRNQLQHALLSLPLRQRAIVVLRHVDGLSERETAAALGCKEGTVKSQGSRAMAALRNYLNREDSRV